jgi:hypothetical protein
MTSEQALSIIVATCTDPRLDYGALRMVNFGAIQHALYMARCAEDIPWDRNKQLGTGEAIAFFGDEGDERSYVLIRKTARKAQIERAVRKCILPED